MKKKKLFNFWYDVITKNVRIEHAKYNFFSWLEVGQKGNRYCVDRRKCLPDCECLRQKKDCTWSQVKNV